jgi:hypothetical protein
MEVLSSMIKSSLIDAMQRRRKTRIAAVSRLLLLLLCAMPVVHGQEFRASISGIITDPTGASVAGATVEVTDVQRQVTVTGLTNETGRYLVEFLIPSTYVMSVTASGFKKYTREGFSLGINDRVAVDVRMQLGDVAESVTVTGQVSPLQTETANRGGIVPNEVVRNLPNNGQNAFNLVFQMPGASRPNFSQNTSFGLAGTQGGSMFSINGNAGGVGGRSWNNDILINGVTDTTQDNNVSFSPAVESIQELQVKTNTYDAQYGRTGGGFVTITTKAGTNQPHGVVFERYFSYALAANTFSNNRTGTRKSTAHTHNPGFEIDGPIYIPKLFNGKNKLFFMLSLDDTIQNTPSTIVSTVPLGAMHTGDFSGLLTSSGQQVLIYDPTTTRLGPDGKTYIRDAFPDNRIPANRISTFGSKIMSLFPNPNLPGIGPGQTSNYITTNATSFPTKQWTGRLDYRLSDKDSIFYQWGSAFNTQFSPGPFPADSLLNFGGVTPAANNNWHDTLNWTRTLNASTTLDVRLGYNRTEQLRSNALSAAFDPTSLGLPASLVAQFSQQQFPTLSLGGYGGSTTSRVNDLLAEQTFSLQGSVGKAIGSHLLKMGGEVRRYDNGHPQPGNASGLFSFSKNWTQANPLVSSSTAGNEVATLLLGYPSAGSVDNNVWPYFKNKYYAIYIQDDWKVSRRLTVNVGLRYDYQSPQTERYNQINRGFAFNQASPLANQVKTAPGAQNCPACANLTGGLLFAGTGGNPSNAWDPHRLDFEPRIGAAFTLDDKTVLRGGFGMYHLGAGDVPTTNGFSSTTSAVTSVDGGLTPSVTMSNPFPNGLIAPSGSSSGLSTFLGSNATFLYSGYRPPTSYQVSFGVQRLLPAGILLETSYVGNYTHGLQVNANYNFTPLTQLGQASSYYLQAVPNPFAGLLPNNASLNGPTIPLQNLMYAYPQFSGVNGSVIPIGSTRYDAWQSTVTRRFHGGLTLMGSYSVAKNLDRLQFLNPQFFNPADPSQSTLDHRLTPFDVPQRLNVHGTWEIPVGRHRNFGSNMLKALNVVIGDWLLSASTTQAKGYPIDFPNAAPLAAQSAKLPSDQQSLYRWFDTSLFPKVAGPAPFTLRTFSSRFPDVRFMGVHNIDMSLSKSIPLYERLKLEFRADFINICNHPFLTSMASLDVTNAAFGQLNLSQNNEPREVYLHVKVRF